MKRRRWRILLAVLGVLLVGIGYLFFYEPPHRSRVPEEEQPLLIAHRGFGNYGPDNGISAVRMAIEQGLDGVDLDGQLTADGELVIFHDPTLERLTDGVGAIKDLTLEELQRLDMGSKFDAKFAGERIVTFGQLLDEVAGRTNVIVEIKAGGMQDEGAEAIAVNEIGQHDAHDYVILSSFNPFVLRRIKALDSRVRTMFIFRDIEPFDPTQYRKIPFFLKSEPWRRAIRKFIQPDLLSIETTVDSQTIDRLQARGYPIFLWVPNDRQQLQASLARRSYGIITDEPLLAIEVAGRMLAQVPDGDETSRPPQSTKKHDDDVD
ncbi:MAG: glycerophosphodiester phosphodiesterase family protein [Planctomycetota bacterium]|nr:glycerophosphodiester phosphodiesterase family protein [Planctomycetota bacterium]